MTKRTKKGDAIWMPWYVGDYLGDTTNLNAEQHGAYLLLLAYSWLHEGYAPNDDSQLANIARMSSAQWKKNKSVVLGFFDLDENGYSQERLLEEFEIAKKRIATKVENGKKGGRPPKDKQTETEYLTEEKPIGCSEDNRSGGLRETQSQSHTQTHSPSSPVVHDDAGTPNSDRVGVVAFQLTDEISLTLEIERDISVEFTQSVFDEWQKFNCDKQPQTLSTWHSRFLQRVYEQWDRKNPPQLRSVS